MRYIRFTNGAGESLLVRVKDDFLSALQQEPSGAPEELFRRFLQAAKVKDLASLITAINKKLEEGERCELLPEDFSPGREEQVELSFACAGIYHRSFIKKSGGFPAVL